ncbi:hypothetical protein LZ32DRAFT_216150 [Colletotrichum eremochloae]|nr:hypothetical protein LZ32DRAFT_216150 [Colletotrichum eremochloae]
MSQISVDAVGRFGLCFYPFYPLSFRLPLAKGNALAFISGQHPTDRNTISSGRGLSLHLRLLTRLIFWGVATPGCSSLERSGSPWSAFPTRSGSDGGHWPGPVMPPTSQLRHQPTSWTRAGHDDSPPSSGPA